jgi:hypothetical protein
MSPASKDVDAFHPISDKRERSTAYLRTPRHAVACAADGHPPSVIDVPVFYEFDEFISGLVVAGGREAHGRDDHARQSQHVDLKAGADVVADKVLK